jgi:ABC-type nitrate/sulfonate/bicarbonate transport system substrate-binding protein
MTMTTRRRFVLVTSAAALAMTGTVHAADALKVMVFPGISNLPLFSAQAQGYFQARNLTVDIINTRSSDELRSGLARGHHQMAHSGVDNAVALVEATKTDAVVVIGGHGGFGQLLVQPDVASPADLRGRTVVIDAPNAAYALVLYKILQNHGLRRSDYAVHPAGGTAAMVNALLTDRKNAAGIVSPPFTFRAERAGLRNLGPVNGAIGAYQFDAGFVLRSWAQNNAGTLVRYIQAYVDGCRWALDPANRSAAVALLSGRLQLPADDAARIYQLIVDPKDGIARDAQLDLDGFRNTLKLRAEIEGQWGGTPPAAERYIDLSFYERAIARH